MNVKRAGSAKDAAEAAARPLISREAFAKISEVEGIHLSGEAMSLFEEFDRLRLTPEERRRAIIGRFKRDAAE
jgi:hypothetical protein